MRRRAVRPRQGRPAPLPAEGAGRRDAGRSGWPSPAPTRVSPRLAAELAAALARPGRRARGARSRGASGSARWSRVSLPGDPQLAAGDRLGQAEPRRLDPVRGGPRDPLGRPGQAVPAARRRARARPLGRRGLPRLPVAVRHRRRVHRVPDGRARPVRGDRGPHARAARGVRHRQRPLRQGRPRVRLRRLDVVRPERRSRQHGRDDQVPERGGADLALDRRQRASATRCTTSRSATCATWCASSTRTGTAGPRGSATSSGRGMGPEKLDNTVYFIRGLYDLADLARSKHDGGTYAWARNLARQAAPALRGRRGGWRTRACTPTRSGRTTRRSSRSTGSRSTPMEAELTVKGRPVPGLTTFDHGTRSLALHETPCFSGERPFNRGLFHTGCGGGPTGAGELHDLRAEHRDPVGRRGQLRAARPSSAATRRPRSSRCSPSRPRAACPTSSRARSRDPARRPTFGKNIDRCWTCRAMFIQAWGHYGSAWPVVHQQLGVRPDLGRGELEVIPQLPSERSRSPGGGSGSATASSDWCGASRAGTSLPHDRRRGQRAGRAARARPHASARLAGGERPPGRPAGEAPDAAHEPRPRGAGAGAVVRTARARGQDALEVRSQMPRYLDRAVAALRQFDGHDGVVKAARALRQRLPGDRSYGDPLSVAGDEPPQLIGQRLATAMNAAAERGARGRLRGAPAVAGGVRGPGPRPRRRAARDRLPRPRAASPTGRSRRVTTRRSTCSARWAGPSTRCCWVATAGS